MVLLDVLRSSTLRPPWTGKEGSLTVDGVKEGAAYTARFAVVASAWHAQLRWRALLSADMSRSRCCTEFCMKAHTRLRSWLLELKEVRPTLGALPTPRPCSASASVPASAGNGKWVTHADRLKCARQLEHASCVPMVVCGWSCRGG